MPVFSRTAFALIAFVIAAPAASAGNCDQEAFAAVVNEVRIELQTVDADNKALLRQKLTALKKRMGWSDDEYIKQAGPIIRDSEVLKFDRQHESLVAQVPEIGKSQKSAAALAGVTASLNAGEDRRCAMLDQLRLLMARLVENSKAKWAYLHQKADTALTVAPGN